MQTELVGLETHWGILTDQQKAYATQLATTIDQYKVWQAQLTDISIPFEKTNQLLASIGDNTKQVLASTQLWTQSLAAAMIPLATINDLTPQIAMSVDKVKLDFGQLAMALDPTYRATLNLDQATKDLAVTTDAAYGTTVQADVKAIALLLNQMNAGTGINKVSAQDLATAWQNVAAKVAGNVAASQQLLAAEQQMGAPLNDQLQVQENILNTLIKQGTQNGVNAGQMLVWNEQLANVKVQQQAILDQTTLLSTTYSNMMKAFGAAWTDLGKGIADAAVSGQNFGAAMTSVLDSLKKELGGAGHKLFDDTAQGRHPDQHQSARQFQPVFNGIFGAGGSTGAVGQTLEKLQQQMTQTAQTMGDTMSKMSQQVQGLAQQTTQGVQQVGQSALQAFSSIFNMVTGALTAIASIVTSFELAHTNTLLTRIEDSTRRMDIVMEGAVLDYLAHLQALDVISGTAMESYGTLVNIEADLGSMAADIHMIAELAAAGDLGGGGGAARRPISSPR